MLSPPREAWRGAARREFCRRETASANSPEAAANIAPFAVTMVFIGLLQSLAFWVLASRWLKTSLLYGALGLAYWLVLFNVGKTPAALLHAMPLASVTAFIILFAAWLSGMRRHRVLKTD